MSEKKTLIKNIIYIVLFAITLVLVYLVNRAVPFMMDDEWYSTILSSDKPICSLSDIFNAQVWHYNNWGGRSMTHTILQLLLWAGPGFADVCNTVMNVILAFVIYLLSSEISGVKFDVCPTLAFLTAIIGMLHGLNANWKMSMYWQAGSANYLYITVFILLFVWCYVRELRQEEVKKLNGIEFFIIPLSILAGWSNENMGPTVFLISVFTILYLRKKKNKISFWMVEGAVLSLAGSVACIVAPGNFVRKEEAVEQKGIWWTLYLRIYGEFKGLLEFLFPALVIAVLLGLTYYAILKKKADLPTLVVGASSIVSCGAMILSPHFPDRASFGSMCFLIVFSVSLAMRILKEKKESALLLGTAAVIVWLRGMYFLEEFLGMCRGWIL